MLDSLEIKDAIWIIPLCSLHWKTIASFYVFSIPTWAITIPLCALNMTILLFFIPFYCAFYCDLSCKVFNISEYLNDFQIFFFFISHLPWSSLGPKSITSNVGSNLALLSSRFHADSNPRRNGIFSKHLSHAPHKALSSLPIPRLRQSRSVQRRDLPREPATWQIHLPWEEASWETDPQRRRSIWNRPSPQIEARQHCAISWRLHRHATELAQIKREFVHGVLQSRLTRGWDWEETEKKRMVWGEGDLEHLHTTGECCCLYPVRAFGCNFRSARSEESILDGCHSSRHQTRKYIPTNESHRRQADCPPRGFRRCDSTR